MPAMTKTSKMEHDGLGENQTDPISDEKNTNFAPKKFYKLFSKHTQPFLKPQCKNNSLLLPLLSVIPRTNPKLFLRVLSQRIIWNEREIDSLLCALLLPVAQPQDYLTERFYVLAEVLVSQRAIQRLAHGILIVPHQKY